MGVYKRSDIWWYDISYQGYRERQAVGPSKKQAEEVYAKRRLALRDEKFFDSRISKELLFNEFIPEYLSYAKTHKKTHERDRIIAKNLLKYFSGMKLSKITAKGIEGYVQFRKTHVIKLTKKPVSNATVNRELHSLSAMFRLAKINNYVKANPVREVKELKEENNKIEFLSLDEINSLLNSAKGYLKPVLMVAIHTGMRRGEILSMKWQNVDFARGIIQVPGPMAKNGKFRVVYMTEELENTLCSLVKRLKCEHVFYNEDGKPFFNLRKSFKSALKKAGISRRFRFHDLRHTFASHCVMNGVDLITLKEMLGHSTTAMVERYAHLSDSHRKEAAKKIGEIFSGGKSKKINKTIK